jgi:hypothetical protein
VGRHGSHDHTLCVDRDDCRCSVFASWLAIANPSSLSNSAAGVTRAIPVSSWKWTYLILNQFDVRKPLVVYISQSREALMLYDVACPQMGTKRLPAYKKRENKFVFPIDIWARGRWPSLNPHFKALGLLGEGKKIGSTTIKHNRLLLYSCLEKPLLPIFFLWRSIYFLCRAIGDSYQTGDNFNVMLSTRRHLCGHVPQNRHRLYIAILDRQVCHFWSVANLKVFNYEISRGLRIRYAYEEKTAFLMILIFDDRDLGAVI